MQVPGGSETRNLVPSSAPSPKRHFMPRDRRLNQGACQGLSFIVAFFSTRFSLVPAIPCVVASSRPYHVWQPPRTSRSMGGSHLVTAIPCVVASSCQPYHVWRGRPPDCLITDGMARLDGGHFHLARVVLPPLRLFVADASDFASPCHHRVVFISPFVLPIRHIIFSRGRARALLTKSDDSLASAFSPSIPFLPTSSISPCKRPSVHLVATRPLRFSLWCSTDAALTESILGDNLAWHLGLGDTILGVVPRMSCGKCTPLH
jgi:hypothetical protein